MFKLLSEYDELLEIVDEIRPYYTVDKVKYYGVFIWTKEENADDETYVFDILADELAMYDDNHVIIEEAKPIIEKIQEKLKEIDCDKNGHSSMDIKVNDVKQGRMVCDACYDEYGIVRYITLGKRRTRSMALCDNCISSLVDQWQEKIQLK